MLIYESFKQLDESNSRGAHDALMKAAHHDSKGDYHREMEFHRRRDEHAARYHRDAGQAHSEAARHFRKAHSLYKARVPDSASQHAEAGHHWAKAASEAEAKHGLYEDISPIERESNKRLHRTDGTQAGPDPAVQREIKNQGILQRATAMASKRRKQVDEILDLLRSLGLPHEPTQFAEGAGVF